MDNSRSPLRMASPVDYDRRPIWWVAGIVPKRVVACLARIQRVLERARDGGRFVAPVPWMWRGGATPHASLPGEAGPVP